MYSVKIGNGDASYGPSDKEELTKEEMLIVEKRVENRAERNNLLSLSDSKVLPDRGLSERKVAEWKTYRQSLRDLDFSDPNDITWPTKPE